MTLVPLCEQALILSSLWSARLLLGLTVFPSHTAALERKEEAKEDSVYPWRSPP